MEIKTKIYSKLFPKKPSELAQHPCNIRILSTNTSNFHLSCHLKYHQVMICSLIPISVQYKTTIKCSPKYLLKCFLFLTLSLFYSIYIMTDRKWNCQVLHNSHQSNQGIPSFDSFLRRHRLLHCSFFYSSTNKRLSHYQTKNYTCK